jgi:hypothetical protein
MQPWALRPLLKHTVATVGIETIVGIVLQQWEPRSLLAHIVTTVGTDHISAVTLDTVVAFVIPFE